MATTTFVPLRSCWRRAWAAAIEHSRIPAACRPQHEALLRARIVVFSRVLAVLTLAWIPVDAVGLGMVHAASTWPLRAVIALGLLALARLARRMPAQALLQAYFWLQAIGFGSLQMLVESARTDAVQIGYGLFPFLLAAQLGLFALPWRRTLLLALAPAAQFAATQLLPWDPRLLPWSGLWLLVLIVAVAAWSSHAQLRLLIRLLGARQDAEQDALTGLSNRRAAARRLGAERSRALRQHEPLSVLMLDLDHFKRVNDRWGHDAGDQVLVAIARLLNEELRGADLAARHGGEEFLAILPDTGPAQALQVAERIRERIARSPTEFSGTTIPITASIGIATLVADEAPAALVARADAAMYAAKQAGRNRCLAAAM